MPYKEIPYSRNYRFKFATAMLSLLTLKVVNQWNNLNLVDVYIAFIAVIMLTKEIFIFINLNKKVRTYPKFPKLSLVLSNHITWSIILDGFYNLLSSFVITKAIDYKGNETLFLFAFLIMVPINRFLLANNTIRLFKQILGFRFSIVIFRRFSSDYSFVMKQVIAPCIGAYGNIISIWDDNLEKAKPGINSDSEDILGESSQSIEASNNSWKSLVLSKIENSDCFVFYWPETPSENLIWEYQSCLKVIPEGARFLFILHDINALKVKEIINKINPNDNSCFIEINTSFIHNGTAYLKCIKLFRMEAYSYFKFLKQFGKIKK